MKNVFLVLAALVIRASAFAQDTFYSIDSIQKIEIFFSQPDWNHQLHVLKITTEGYLKADSVRINGQNFKNVGVKYKGNSSYDSTWIKNPFTISMDKYQSQNYQGYTDIKLSNCYQDPSMIREVLSYAIVGKYMDAPRSNFAQVSVNGVLFGLYSSVEDITKGFCARHFKSSKNNTFIKCNPILTPGPNVKSNLKYLSEDSAAYTNYYELKSATGWGQLSLLCHTASNYPIALPTMLDIDRFIWMLAFDNVLVNLDSYMGAFAQNYFLFKDNNGIFNPIIWDLNMSLGGFPFAGSSNSSLGSLSVANIKQFPIDIHKTDVYWPVINVIQSNPRYKKTYQAHIRTMVNEIFNTAYFDSLATHLQSLAQPAALADTNKFFTDVQFQTALTTDISVGTYQVPGLKPMMLARTSYLLARPEIAATPPAITSISGTYDGNVHSGLVVANLSNHHDTAVYVGYRANPAKKFQRIRMWDDGLHGDGAAGDQQYGATFSTDSANTQFYIYAENENASSFSPERAEFEFHKLTEITSVDLFQSNRKSSFSLYPNPASNLVQIEAPAHRGKMLEILDMMGRSVYSKVLNSAETVDVSSFSSGIYSVRIGSQLKKLVVNN